MNKYKSKKGDSWIKIANNNNISLDDLLYWNGIDPTSNQQLPILHPNQEIYIDNPYKLNPAIVEADAPVEYGEYKEKGQDKITQYALAVNQGAMKFNQVPDTFKTAVYQRMNILENNKTANVIANTGANIGMFLLNPSAYLSGLLAQKGVAYTTDAISGKHEYNIGTVLGNTPIMGTNYQKENPGKSLLIDAATGIIGGTLLRNFYNIFNPSWRNSFAQAFKSNVQNVTGMSNQNIPMPAEGAPIYKGSVYQSGIKGLGKSGNWTRGNNIIGYKPVSTPKATFSHQASASFLPKGTFFMSNTATPMPTISIPIGYGGINVPGIEYPIMLTDDPKQHIYEQQSFNRWQMPNPGQKVGPYLPGTGRFSITGEAPIGSTINDQALTNESINTYHDYLPRKAVYVPGEINGTPSNIHSGLGIMYNSENPDNLIIK